MMIQVHMVCQNGILVAMADKVVDMDDDSKAD